MISIRHLYQHYIQPRSDKSQRQDSALSSLLTLKLTALTDSHKSDLR